MKKFLAALLLTATTAGVASANMTGFYVGVGAVTGATTAKYTDVANTVPAVTDNAGASFRNDAGKTMFGGRIEAGYGMTFAGCGWFGASVYTTLLNTKIRMVDTLSSPSMSFRTAGTLHNKYNFGVELKIGYHFTKDTVGFVGIAAEVGKYKLDWTAAFIDTNAQVSLVKRSTSKTKVYAKPVIGIRTTGIGGNRNLFVEAKYGYGFANRVTLNVEEFTLATGGFLVAGPGTNGRKVTARPRVHDFSVTIGWRF